MKFKRYFHSQKGVTLTETIIYVAIFAIVVLTVLALVTQLITLKKNADAYSIIGTEVANVFETMIQDVRNAQSFTVVNETTLQTTTDGIISEYRFENGGVTLIQNSQSYLLTTNQLQVTELTFTDWTSPSSDDLLHIELSVERGGINEQFQTSIHVR